MTHTIRTGRVRRLGTKRCDRKTLGLNMKRFLLATALCLAPAAAHAQFGNLFANDIFTETTDLASDLMDTLLPGVTNVRVGLGPVVGTTYEGGNDYKVRAAPLISLRYRDIVQVDNNQLRVNLLGQDGAMWESRNFRAGPMVKVDFGRSAKNSPDLTGLGNVSTSLELGAFVSYTTGPLRYRIRTSQDIASGHKGLLTDLDVSLAVYRSKILTVGGRLGTTYAGRKYMQSYFGVTAAQATASGLPAYTPGSGFKNVSVSMGGEYRVTPSWTLVMNGGYERLVGKVADSPLVSLRGSANQFSFGTYAAYAF